MIRVLSKEYDAWWNELDICSKSRIFNFCREILNSKEMSKAIRAWESSQSDQYQKIVLDSSSCKK